MRDIEVTVSVRNNQLKERRLNAGLSQADFCIACGINLNVYGRLECLQASPIDSYGQWKDIALQIASHYQISPSEIWPAETCAIKQHKSVRTLRAADRSRLAGVCDRAALGPMESFEKSELKEAVNRSLDLLTADERRVIDLRFGLEGSPVLTLDEVGSMMKKSRERVRQLETTALRRLGQPRKNPLRKFNELFTPPRKGSP